MSLDLSAYRPNVGIVLFNAEGLVWIGKRTGAPEPFNWQFPQGGIDAGEDFEVAARRELHEETGAYSIELIGQTDGWIVYDFTPEALEAANLRGFKGQKQKWFAFRFTGQDSEFDLAAHEQIEFDAWRWATLAEAVEGVVPFKRAAYEQVAAAFAGLVGV